MSAWATYIGGHSEDTARRGAMDAHGNVYVAGSTLSGDLHPALVIQPPATQVEFLMQIRPGGELGWALPLGSLPEELDVEAQGDGTVHLLHGVRDAIGITTIDRSGSRIREITLPTSAGHQYVGRQLALDTLGGMVLAASDLTARAIVLARLAPDGSVRYVRSLPYGGRLGDLGVDISGNIYLTGYSIADDIPTTPGSFQPRNRLGQCAHGEVTSPCADAFLIKLDPNGELLYGTFFGGGADDRAERLAVDLTGAAIIAGRTSSPDLPLQNPLQARCKGTFYSAACGDMFVTKFDPTGRALVFSTFLGGNGDDAPQALALDATGAVVLAATVTGSDLPVVRPAQATNGAGPVFSSPDGGQTWRTARIEAGEVRQFAWTPGSPRVYAATDHGVFWSSDGGRVWAGTPDAPTRDVRAIAVDPMAPSTVYAAAFGGGVFKTTDAGRTWTAANTGLVGTGFDGLLLRALAVAPSAPSTVYAAGRDGLFRSSDGAASWTRMSGHFSAVHELIVDPAAPMTVWGAGTEVVKSIDGGATLAALGALPQLPSGPAGALPETGSIAFDRIDSNTVYVGRARGIARSRDAGAFWQPFTAGLPEAASAWYDVAIDPTAPQRLYAVAGDVYRATTTDATWEPLGVALPPQQGGQPRSDSRRTTEISANGAILLGASASSSDAYLAAIEPTGTLRWSTYLGGTHADSAVAVGVYGRSIHLVGLTRSPGWPLAESAGRAHAGGLDLFFARVWDATGTILRR